MKRQNKAAKLKFYAVRGAGMITIHIVPIFLLAYFLYNINLITKLIIYAIYSIFYHQYIATVLTLTFQFFMPLAIYCFIGLLLWALLLWPLLRKYFKPLYLETDGIQLREGRVWWRAPNRLTNKFKEWADKAGIEYKNESIWLYRVGKLINPFKPLSSLNKLYVPEEVKDSIEIKPKRIIFHNLYILQYKDGYILSRSKFRSEHIDVDKLNEIIKEDSKRISSTVGDYALTNPELRVKNVSSALFWVPPANLEVKEHLEVGSESVAYQILEQLLEQYDENKKKALKDGVITQQEISSMLLPMFNQILIYVNSMKAKFGNDELPNPPDLKNNLITMQQIDGYINEVKTAIKAYYNPEVFKK